jgi:hypothetical protein
MFETYSQLGKLREAELLQTADRSRRRIRTRPRHPIILAIAGGVKALRGGVRPKLGVAELHRSSSRP